jgi:hypothetical protein
LLTSEDGAPKTRDLAQRDLLQILTKNFGQPHVLLSITRHSGHMEPTKPVKTILIVLGLAMCACWALLIWIATVVTDTMLRVLAYVVELAQMS